MPSPDDTDPATAPRDSGTRGEMRYRRVLLKVSGEAFCKPGGFGIEGDELAVIAGEVAAAAKVGAQLGVVVGGGNIIRGARLAKQGWIAQATADHMGMLGTIMNAAALAQALNRLGQPARVLSAIDVPALAQRFTRDAALHALNAGEVVVFAGGIGNPFLTTDTTAALRAAEIDAQAVLKATKVDGVYDKDPVKHPDARRFDRISFDEAIERKLGVMDMAALCLCMERSIPVVVFDMNRPGHIAAVVRGEPIGTLVR